MDILFNWRNEDENSQPIWKDITNVHFIISKANSIHHDPFTEMKYNPSLVDSYTMAKENDNERFYKQLQLPLGVYHFIFEVYLESGDEHMECSSEYKQTILANGRHINYIEIGAISPRSTNSYSDCVANHEEASFLLPHDVIVDDDSTVIESNTKSCCCCCC